MVGDPSKSQSRPLASAAQFMRYGGGAFVVSDDAVYFSNFLDQILYKTGRNGAGSTVLPVMGAGTDTRYADGVFDRKHHRLVIVREHHPVRGKRDAINSLVSIDPNAKAPERKKFSSRVTTFTRFLG